MGKNKEIIAYGIHWGTYSNFYMGEKKQLVEQLVNELHTCLPNKQKIRRKVLSMVTGSLPSLEFVDGSVLSSHLGEHIYAMEIAKSIIADFRVAFFWDEEYTNMKWRANTIYSFDRKFDWNRKEVFELAGRISPGFGKEARLRKAFVNEQDIKVVLKAKRIVREYFEEKILEYLIENNIEEKIVWECSERVAQNYWLEKTGLENLRKRGKGIIQKKSIAFKK